MTQSVTNTLNNLEQMLSSTKNVQKVAEKAMSGMDKPIHFRDVLGSKLNEEESLTIIEMKNKNPQKDVPVMSADFKEIIEKATDEANVETSLDLTLARDINEIISQLKDAVEKATEIVEENSEELKVLKNLDELEETDLAEELATIIQDSDIEIEDCNKSQIEESNKEQKIPFEQILVFADKTATDLEQAREIIEMSSEKDSTSLMETLKTVQAEFVEIAENLSDEVVKKATASETESSGVDINIEEKMLSELKIESLSAELDYSSENDFLQNQTPEELGIKTMINAEVETFELKVDSSQNVQGLQNVQQAQHKSIEVNPSRIIDQIAKQMEGLQNGGKVNIVLNPESLGKVNIQLLSTKEGLTAQFTVTTQEARDLLSKGLDGLKESLGAHGVAVDNVSVKVADSQKSEYGQDWTEQDGSRGGNKRQGQPNREEKEKGLFEKMMAQTQENENGNV